MSIEHVFAMKMKQMYEHYTVRTQQRIVQQLSEKVRCPTDNSHSDVAVLSRIDQGTKERREQLPSFVRAESSESSRFDSRRISNSSLSIPLHPYPKNCAID